LEHDEGPAPAGAPLPPEPHQPAGPTAPARPQGKGPLRDFVETVVLALIVFVIARTIVMNYRVIGHSMEPNVHEGQYLFVDKLPYNWGTPRRGDIVVLRPPDVAGQFYLKRIIGLPGETVEIHGGDVYVDGQIVKEPWATRAFPDTEWGPARVGEGELFVLGDNRPGSRDSRHFGMLTRDHVVGRAFLCYWPPNQWTTYGRYR